MRNFNDWDVDMVASLLRDVQRLLVTLDDDEVLWKGGESRSFLG